MAITHNILNEITLPSLYLITPEPTGAQKFFLLQLEKCLAKGIKLVQFRAKNLSKTDYSKLAKKVIEMCHEYQCYLVLNGEIELANNSMAQGVHLTSAQLVSLDKRPAGKEKLVSAACHSEDELLHAENIGVDFVTLSPVLSTTSHPEVSPLGWERFSKLVSLVNIPIYALGGMLVQHVMIAQQHGAKGIAAISALWNQ